MSCQVNDGREKLRRCGVVTLGATDSNQFSAPGYSLPGVGPLPAIRVSSRPLN